MSNIGPSEMELWYKCVNCNICINSRNRFLVHIYSHDTDFGEPPKNQDQAIFHTSNGNIMKITQLPNSYEIYTPKILFCPIEDISRRYAFKIQQPRIVLLRQTEAELQEALQKELIKRKLREKPRRKYSALDMDTDIHEDDLIDWDEEDHDDSDDSYEPAEEHMQDIARGKIRKFQGKLSNVRVRIRRPKNLPSGSLLVCVPCKATFFSPADYTVHVNQAHFKDGKYFCTDCPFQSTLKVAFNKHNGGTCSGASYKVIKCNLCYPVTDWTYRLSYLKHIYSHKVNGRYPCPHCSLTEIKLCSIADHVLKMHGDAADDGQRTNFPTRYIRPRYQYNKRKKAMDFIDCKKCGKSFHKSHIKQHLKTHKLREERSASKPFKCAVCKDGFTKQEALQRHFQMHLSDNPYICQFPGCGQRLNSRYNLKRHSTLHYARKTFSCEICNVEYAREHRLLDHNKIYHPVDGDGTAPAKIPLIRFRQRRPAFRIKPYKPPVLPPTTPRLRDPDEDAPRPEGGMNIGSIHLGDDETIKTECREAMLDVMDELESRGTVKSEEPAPAAEVHQNTGSNSNATIFSRLLEKDPLVKRLAVEDPAFVDLLSTGKKHTIHGDFDAFPCKICVPQVNYPRLYHLQAHMKQFHPEEAAKNSLELAESELMFTCGSCGFQTRTSQQLSRHMKTHNPKKLHCVTCGSRFQEQVKLDEHVKRVHLAEKCFKCTKCDKAFPNDFFRRRHEKTVHPPPPKNPEDLICKHCGKKSTTPRALRVHVQLHSKTRVLSYCKICNEKLSCPASLRRHIRLVHMRAKKASVENTEEAIPESELFL